MTGSWPPSWRQRRRVKSVRRLRKVSGVSVSGMDVSTIGRVVVLGGTFLIEYKRKTAIREVVERAHGPILATIGAGEAGLRSRLRLVERRLSASDAGPALGGSG